MRKFIRTERLTHEQIMAFCDEAERQGCRIRMSPADDNPITIHGTRRRAYLTWDAWRPEPRNSRQTGTLWPKPLPVSWIENGIPRRTITRPIRYPQRLIDALKIGD